MDYHKAIEIHARVSRLYDATHKHLLIVKNQRPTGGEVGIHRGLLYGETYFIAAPIMQMLLSGPAQTVPASTRIAKEDFPSPYGTVIFDGYYTISTRTGPVKVGGLVWDTNQQVTAPSATAHKTALHRRASGGYFYELQDPTKTYIPDVPGVMIATLEKTPDPNTIFKLTGHHIRIELDPTFYATWRYTDTMGDAITRNYLYATDDSDDDGDATKHSFPFIAALLAFMKQRILVREARTDLPKDTRRTLRAIDPTSTRTTVNVIRLRRKDGTTLQPPMTRTGLPKFQMRWFVRGHWHHYRCGPGRADTRLLWTDQYIKGPPDAPIKPTLRVFDVSR